jgi:hypothetical protein
MQQIVGKDGQQRRCAAQQHHKRSSEIDPSNSLDFQT